MTKDARDTMGGKSGQDQAKLLPRLRFILPPRTVPSEQQHETAKRLAAAKRERRRKVQHCGGA